MRLIQPCPKKDVFMIMQWRGEPNSRQTLEHFILVFRVLARYFQRALLWLWGLLQKQSLELKLSGL